MMLAAFFLPIANPLAVTLMVLLVTSWVYPTKELMAMVTERGDTSDIIEDTIEGLRAEMANIHTPTILRRRRLSRWRRMWTPCLPKRMLRRLRKWKSLWTTMLLLRNSLLRGLSATKSKERKTVNAVRTERKDGQDVPKTVTDGLLGSAFPSVEVGQTCELLYVELFIVR
jgi:hypothetical protein